MCACACARIGSGINPPGLNYSLRTFSTLGKLSNFSKSRFPSLEIGIALAPSA